MWIMEPQRLFQLFFKTAVQKEDALRNPLPRAQIGELLHDTPRTPGKPLGTSGKMGPVPILVKWGPNNGKNNCPKSEMS